MIVLATIWLWFFLACTAVSLVATIVYWKDKKRGGQAVRDLVVNTSLATVFYILLSLL